VTVSNTVRVNEATVKVTATTCGASSPVVNAIHSTRTSMNIGDTMQLTADVTDADNAAPCSQNQTFTYTWELLRQPNGSTASLNNAHSETPSLTADKGGDYVVRLTVKDSTGLSSQPKTFTVTVGNCGATNPTVVIAAPATAIAPNSPAQLTATASDADAACGAQAFTYQWSVRARPDGATASFSSSVIRNPLFTADKAGQHEIGVDRIITVELRGEPLHHADRILERIPPRDLNHQRRAPRRRAPRAGATGGSSGHHRHPRRAAR